MWPDQHVITRADSRWRCSAEAVTPFAYYRLQFEAHGAGPGFWAAVFSDKDGNELPDHCDAVFASGHWLPHEFCFRAHACATRLCIQFDCQQHDLHVRNVSVAQIGRRDVLPWADGIAAANPPLRFTPPPDRQRRLARTWPTLERGGQLRIVLLGDSIANDTANSAFDVLLERARPGCSVEVVSSVRSSTGCWYYRDAGRVAPYVLDHEPDLLIIAGISHQFDLDATQSVVEQVQRGSSCDILVMTGAVAPHERYVEQFVRESKLDTAAARVAAEGFPVRLAEMAAAHGAAFLDMRAVWDGYIRESGKPLTWFLRDDIHANLRGRQVLARVLVRYFSDGV